MTTTPFPLVVAVAITTPCFQTRTTAPMMSWLCGSFTVTVSTPLQHSAATCSSVTSRVTGSQLLLIANTPSTTL